MIMSMITTMLQEELAALSEDKKNKNDIVELFYQRLYNIVEHLKFDINTLQENVSISKDDLKDLYMITDIYSIQIEEVIDRIKRLP